MIDEKINKIFKCLELYHLNPTTELLYDNEFELLIAVVLSAQTTDTMVNKCTQELFKIANTPSQMIELGVEELEGYIKRINFFKTKAKNIINLSHRLIEKYDSKVPNDYESLINLPGVGRKTANVILNTIFEEERIAVDTHIFRVSRRLGLSTGTSPLKVEEDLTKIVPKAFRLKAHHLLILHGRYVCRAKKPKCEKCLLSQNCDFFMSKSLNL
jgi:endonuclease-3